MISIVREGDYSNNMAGIYTINGYLVSGIIAFKIISDGFSLLRYISQFPMVWQGGIACFSLKTMG